MAEQNGDDRRDGGFFLGAIFAAIIFFFLFFTGRRGLRLGADSSASGANATGGGNAVTGGASAAGCVKVCDECDAALTPTPYEYKPAPPRYIGGFTEVATPSNTQQMFNGIGQVINPLGGNV